MQSASQIADRLESFRTGTLASFEPLDKKNEAAKAEFDELLESTLGLDNFPVTELPVINTRAGLYVYLNACVSLSVSYTMAWMEANRHQARRPACHRRCCHLQLPQQSIQRESRLVSVHG